MARLLHRPNDGYAATLTHMHNTTYRVVYAPLRNFSRFCFFFHFFLVVLRMNMSLAAHSHFFRFVVSPLRAPPAQYILHILPLCCRHHQHHHMQSNDMLTDSNHIIHRLCLWPMPLSIQMHRHICIVIISHINTNMTHRGIIINKLVEIQ